ncbi:MAG TPA: branched-chain amino acid ABC transporter ATP-binding protein/permease [Burkholderiaceae bacterium]|nr:branched-chain amino acid ABC transporter ATP-binding protein/permease [Burkholderiaceae bacterium]
MPPPRSLVQSPILTAAVLLVVLPFALLAGGLTMTSATDVVIFAVACMALNILVGQTGLVSFGHGAWFGLGAYAAALAQLHWFRGSMLWPTLFALVFLTIFSAAIGFLVLRRRGVYFSLLTLALSALVYSVAFRWTAFTGGENGLGGLTRANWLGADLENRWVYYALVASIGLATVYGLSRFHVSPIGSVLNAIRENEQRAQFIGYPTARYKLVAFILSSVLTGFAGVLFAFHHRFASADPTAVSFSGELLAMVIIGGMRSLLGPALGALFYILFREYLSIWTANWLWFFGLLFVGFIVFSPSGLVGLWQRVTAPLRKRQIGAAAMAGRAIEENVELPAFVRAHATDTGTVLAAEHLAKSFGGIRAVQDASIAVGVRSLHALIGPNGAGKTTLFNLISGLLPPDRGRVVLAGKDITRSAPHRIVAAGVARSFQITNLFPALTVHENLRLAVQARARGRFNGWTRTTAVEAVMQETTQLVRFLGLSGIERAEAAELSYGGQRLLDMGLALACAPRVLLLDEPLAGLAAAERERVAQLVKRISSDLPVLLVEHDIDRVFALADRVTVMNDGKVLFDGNAADARASEAVREIYIGSGTAALAATAHGGAERSLAPALLTLDAVDAFYGKSHIIKSVGLTVHEHEIVALLGRNGAGKSTLLKTIVGTVPPANGTITLGDLPLARLPAWQIARLGVGYVPQGRALFAGMSVRHNLELARLKRHGTKRGSGVAWSDDKIIEFFPKLAARLDTPADFLSGGEQQMVAVARALAGHVRILLLDEPFEGLAPTVIEELFSAFERLRAELAIVIVEHNLDLVLALADRAYVLERGSVVHQGAASALRENLELRRQVLWM